MSHTLKSPQAILAQGSSGCGLVCCLVYIASALMRHSDAVREAAAPRRERTEKAIDGSGVVYQAKAESVFFFFLLDGRQIVDEDGEQGVVEGQKTSHTRSCASVTCFVGRMEQGIVMPEDTGVLATPPCWGRDAWRRWYLHDQGRGRGACWCGWSGAS